MSEDNVEIKTKEIDVTEAVAIACQQIKLLFKDELPIRNLALEEVEFDESGGEWLVTLGYDSPHKIVRKTGVTSMPLMPHDVEEEVKDVIILDDLLNGKEV
ncbi:hypothetical protein [Thioflexithrix psekupsensis]|uniref:Uncharacterized protein n=1 Tax=Thioflexithrix psekupsensis TaxID=1570016 RepID=A0A251XAE1_9GAMM|nr:hypothetical protein [Thioflexithrix psekupsensis]OUD15304.1 hypothetical protein TPSD3_01885 [Thioflexithrix psekupsensis]